MHLLKPQKIWLCWNWVIRGGKRTKVLIAASGCTTGVDESYRCIWATYDEAVKAAEEHGYAGVGFVIPKKYFFLDIDKRDIAHPLVQMLLRRYNSYAEKSISGNGIHIYGTCDLSRLPTYTDEKGRLRLARDFYMKSPDDLEPYISVPLLAKYTKEHIRYILVRDNGNQGVRLYVYEQGVYKLYATDMLQAVIKGYVEEYDMELVSMGQISAAANIILTDLNYVRQDELNADEGIINFQNGILRLADMALLPHSPEVLSTIQIPCEWHDNPTSTPVYDAYLSRLVNYDAERELGISVRFEEQNIDSLTDEGELMLTLMASVAQTESESISENVKWAIRKAFQKEIGNTKRRTFGYYWVEGTMTVIQEEAEIVERIFRDFLAGESQTKIAGKLTREGVTSVNGNPISRKKVMNTGELPQYFVKDTHEAIIDMDTFHRVQGTHELLFCLKDGSTIPGSYYNSQSQK